MAKIGELMKQRAEETAALAERLANEELQKRIGSFARLLKDVLVITRENLSDDREARLASRRQEDEALLSQMSSLATILDKRQRETLQSIRDETLQSIRDETRRDRWNATFRAALIGGLAGALLTAALLAILVTII